MFSRLTGQLDIHLEFNKVCSCLRWEGVQIVTMCVLLVPQAPPYTEDEAWTMYFKAEDADWQAVFAKEDLEFVKYDREFISSELRETNNRMKDSDERDKLRT